jgi:hypothetical protein
MRSAKGASWARTRSSISTPCHAEEVLVGCKCLDALGEAFQESFGSSGSGLVSDRVHDTEHVLGAMIDFAHEELVSFRELGLGEMAVDAQGL